MAASKFRCPSKMDQTVHPNDGVYPTYSPPQGWLKPYK